MNERLEIEIARYSGRISPDKAKNQPFATLDKCARHFYKLALEDVKREVKAIYEIHAGSGSSGNIYFDGFCTACEQTFRIINNLTK